MWLLGNLLATRLTGNVLRVHRYIMEAIHKKGSNSLFFYRNLAEHHHGNKTAKGRSLAHYSANANGSHVLVHILETLGTVLQPLRTRTKQAQSGCCTCTDKTGLLQQVT